MPGSIASIISIIDSIYSYYHTLPAVSISAESTVIILIFSIIFSTIYFKMLSAESLKIFTVVSAYFVISIALVFSNKILLSGDGSTIPAPIFVTWFQCVLTALIIWILGKFSENSSKTSCLQEFPIQHYKLPVAKSVLPLSIMFVLMITFNNLCLKYVEVSFYNVARSLTIVVNVIFTYLLLNERTSGRTLICLCIVIFGFFVGSEGETNFSLIGTVFGVLASCFVSLNAIYTKKIMPMVDNDKWRLQYYNNVNASILFFPVIFIAGEHNQLLSSKYAHLLVSSYYWGIMFIAGVLGFAIGIVTIMQINITSPLTHNISGTAKACVQTLLALMIWRNPTTFNAMLGVFLVIFGSALYTYVRHCEMESEKSNNKLASAAANSHSNLHSNNNINSNNNNTAAYKPLNQSSSTPLSTDEDLELEEGKLTKH